MILIDTSVWADHFRTSVPELVGLLSKGRVICHSHVVGELALGNLRDWQETVGALRALPQALEARSDELLALVEQEKLMGRGIGFTDAHLLAATRLTPGARLWTRDKRLHTAAIRLNVQHDELRQ